MKNARRTGRFKHQTGPLPARLSAWISSWPKRQQQAQQHLGVDADHQPAGLAACRAPRWPIQLTGTASNGVAVNVTKLGSETFHVSSPVVFPRYIPDAIVSRIGTTSSHPAGILVNILESVGGPLSDQVWVHVLGNVTVIDFISDPDQFVTGVTPFTTVVETGVLQSVLDYRNDQNELVSINILSDVPEVPEPASLALVGAALLGIVAARKRRAARPLV